MGRYCVYGGNSLQGRVRISGAKNAALPIMAGALLSAGKSVIKETPKIKDIYTMGRILSSLGAKVEHDGNECTIDAAGVCTYDVPETLTREMRASICLLGPLLGRFGRARLSYPGGCSLGPRPINLHLRGLSALGVKISEKYGYIEALGHDLRGANIYLDFPSVGTTENLMMAAVLAKGQTILRNVAKEPEVVELQNFLNQMGAKIKGAGTDTIKIMGVSELNPVEHSVIPDRIEAGTFMVAAAISRGEITISNVIPEHLEPVTAKLRQAGVNVEIGMEEIAISASEPLHPVDFRTLPYPGFPTDMLPQMMAFMTTIQGTSMVTENVTENRFKHVDELRRLGGNIKVEGRVAVVEGGTKLTGATVEATDLRAGAALVLAGIAAEGVTTVEQIHHVDRGYEDLADKLNVLGAKITRE